jgi:ABC-2 type transport system ATP-binding protein
VSSPAIALHALTKYYGDARGVIDLDLEVDRGEVFGFLGPNGAGKTTTIRLLLDLIRPTSGSATVLGLDSVADSTEIRRRVGYLPGEMGLWPWMTTRQALDHLSTLRGLDGDAHYRDLLDRFEVQPDRKISDLSTGNKQKVGIIQAFMHEPDLVILDEPTSGLDPLMQQATYELIEDAQRDGRTVFLSSHVLPEVERVAKRVGIIRQGRLVEVEDMAALKQRTIRQIEVRFGHLTPSVEALASIEGVSDVTASGAVAHLRLEGSVDPLIKTLAQFEVVSLHTHDTPLEEIFLALYAGTAE